MLHFSRWSILGIIAVTLFGVLLALPNILPQSVSSLLPSSLNRGLVLGLDLQGGAHVVLALDDDKLNEDLYTQLLEDVHRNMRDRELGDRIGFSDRGATKDGVFYEIRNAEDASEARSRINLLNEGFVDPTTGFASASVLISKASSRKFNITYTDAAINDRRSKLMQQAIEVIRRRVDELGTTEPTIQQQGLNRILVQIPGLSDTTRLEEILKKTAKLSLHLVDNNSSPNAIASTSIELPYRDFPEQMLIIQKFAPITGENLVDAAATFDHQSSEPVVSFRLDASGARVFGRLTAENIGRPFAIVLDNQVISAPVIQAAITQGAGIISGGFTITDANDLALLLRAGALPVDLEIIEERTVGASLGADAVAAGKVAGILAIILVAVFMIASYGLFGFFANFALIANIAIVIGLLSALGATLTLPGIAGIVLTIGMAVDANVLIFERIKEEVRQGRSAINAIDAGFSRAFTTILDANITTLIAAVVLFFLGSGPIRGFSVTLAIGVVTTIFTAYALTRLFVALWVQRKKPKTLPI